MFSILKATAIAFTGLAARPAMRPINLAAMLLGMAGPVYAQTTLLAPVMSETLMERLIKRTLASTVDTTLNKEIARFFGLGDGKANLPVKSIENRGPVCLHTLMIPVRDSKDILISCAREDSKYFYLTDKSGTLRAAAISTDSSSLARPALQRTGRRRIQGHLDATRLPGGTTACPMRRSQARSSRRRP